METVAAAWRSSYHAKNREKKKFLLVCNRQANLITNNSLMYGGCRIYQHMKNPWFRLTHSPTRPHKVLLDLQRRRLFSEAMEKMCYYCDPVWHDWLNSYLLKIFVSYQWSVPYLNQSKSQGKDPIRPLMSICTVQVRGRGWQKRGRI